MVILIYGYSQLNITVLLLAGFSCCIIASPKVHPTATLAALWPLLAPSAAWVVYSPWVQPLAEAYTHLQAAKCSVLLQLQESWLRPHQVSTQPCGLSIPNCPSWHIAYTLRVGSRMVRI